MNEPVTIHIGDVLDGLAKIPDGSVQCCVTSPPYWGLRDYGVEGQIGLEPTPDAFVAAMVRVFGEVKRTLREDGTLWLNLGDSYAGSTTGADMPPEPGHDREDNGRVKTGKGENKHRRPASGFKPKDLCMMPWRVALALQADGWYLRSVIVWAKKSPMPESVTDRPTSSWEPIFLMAKNERYFYDADAVKEEAINAGAVVGGGHKHSNTETVPGAGKQNLDKLGESPLGNYRNQRNVWHLGPEMYADAHFATFPTEIPRRAIKAGTSEKGCCPACGAPWKRVTTREKLTRERPNDYTKRSGENGTGNHCANTVAGVITRTTGWAPGCGCAAGEPVPCLVLDPFLGSGTTIAVARELGRHGVGCELNPAYAELARIRIGKAEKPATFVDPRAKDSPLFEGAAQ
jgi:DNA modification methylase